jgi:ABC-type glycerol-3-phosphate transport system substrate-binding protein
VVNHLANEFNSAHPDIHVVTSNIPGSAGGEKLPYDGKLPYDEKLPYDGKRYGVSRR